MELCDFSTDGKFVATVSPGSSEIILWNAEKALAEERTLSGHSKPVTALSFSSDGRFLVTTAQVLPRVFQTLCPDPREELYNSTGDIANVIPIYVRGAYDRIHSPALRSRDIPVTSQARPNLFQKSP